MRGGVAGFQPKLVPVSFDVSPKVFAGLAERAKQTNVRPAEYARRLFEAAYAARIAGERGEESGDAALDRQVKATFLLADCEPEFIAENLGTTTATVERILEGWRWHFRGEG